MKHRVLVLSVVLLLFPVGCRSGGKTQQDLPAGVHQVKLVKHLHTTRYTYLLVSEKGKEYWLAVPRMNAEDGKKYYYKGGMLMTNFHSHELNRDFASILFLEKVAKDITSLEQPDIPASAHSAMVKKKGPLDIQIAPPPGGITIATLIANKEKYEGKSVLLRGKVTKINRHIMGKNWIHLQDGTAHEGVYEITITSQEDFHEGDTITFKGRIVLNKDLGFGYHFNILMEDAVSVK